MAHLKIGYYISGPTNMHGGVLKQFGVRRLDCKCKDPVTPDAGVEE